MTDQGWILLGAGAILVMCLIAVAFVVAARPPRIGREWVARLRSRNR
jgi:hypothetical protein